MSHRATALLLYRTSEFKTYFFQYPKELDMLLSWNQAYDFPLGQLRLRVTAEEWNDFSGKSDDELIRPSSGAVVLSGQLETRC